MLNRTLLSLTAAGMAGLGPATLAQQNTLTERQQQEVRALVQEIMADAHAQSSMLDGHGGNAGYDGSFFLASPEGDFRLNVSGQLQLRWIMTSQDNRFDEEEAGFQVARTKLKFDGYFGDPDIGYTIRLANDSGPGSNNARIQDAYISYAYDDNTTIHAGRTTLPFLRQELIDSAHQVAVERALVNEFFTLDRSDQIQLDHVDGNSRLRVAFSDGSAGGGLGVSDFPGDTVEMAITARYDTTLNGDASQGADNIAWVGEDVYTGIGAAVHYETGDANNGGVADYFAWTVDAAHEAEGIAYFAALTGATIDPDAGADRDMLGVLLQATMNVDDEWAPFVRWELIDQDAAGVDEIEAVTIGINHFMRGHSAKVTADILYIYAGSTGGGNGFGAGIGSGATLLGIDTLASPDADEFLALRIQFQLLF